MLEILGLAVSLEGAFTDDGGGAAGDECWLANCLRSSCISFSISMFLDRFPTRLKDESILHSSLRRLQREQDL